MFRSAQLVLNQYWGLSPGNYKYDEDTYDTISIVYNNSGARYIRSYYPIQLIAKFELIAEVNTAYIPMRINYIYILFKYREKSYVYSNW